MSPLILYIGNEIMASSGIDSHTQPLSALSQTYLSPNSAPEERVRAKENAKIEKNKFNKKKREVMRMKRRHQFLLDYYYYFHWLP